MNSWTAIWLFVTAICLVRGAPLNGCKDTGVGTGEVSGTDSTGVNSAPRYFKQSYEVKYGWPMGEVNVGSWANYAFKNYGGETTNNWPYNIANIPNIGFGANIPGNVGPVNSWPTGGFGFGSGINFGFGSSAGEAGNPWPFAGFSPEGWPNFGFGLNGGTNTGVDTGTGNGCEDKGDGGTDDPSYVNVSEDTNINPGDEIDPGPSSVTVPEDLFPVYDDPTIVIDTERDNGFASDDLPEQDEPNADGEYGADDEFKVQNKPVPDDGTNSEDGYIVTDVPAWVEEDILTPTEQNIKTKDENDTTEDSAEPDDRNTFSEDESSEN